ncbi:MAG: serine/threonine protein kinase [Deltaproteobacteria bacterium]|nr:serine/threonine protein kinase [Deltaproteobacteria bacterium]
MNHPGDILFDRFTLVDCVGSGGVASVWRAVDGEDGREVALKILHPHLRRSKVVCQRFRREVDIGKRLEHPAIAATYEAFEDAELLGFSMELLSGQTLKDRLALGGPLAIDELRRVARAVLDGLERAHDSGIIQRDLTARNVFLCESGEVKLLDFGFARVADATGLTTRSVLMCTPEYAAPEVVLGRSVDARCDLYSLGVVLYEAATGRLPYEGASTFELLQKQVEDRAPDPRVLRPDLPAELSAVIARLTAKEPAARFDTCLAVRAALERPEIVPVMERPARRGICQLCGQPMDPTWPFCLYCGRQPAAETGGRWMVVLTRAQLDLEIGLQPRPTWSRASRPSRPAWRTSRARARPSRSRSRPRRLPWSAPARSSRPTCSAASACSGRRAPWSWPRWSCWSRARRPCRRSRR